MANPLILGARFHEEAQVSALTEILFEDAKNYLHMHLENFSLQNIQACILVAYLSAAAMKPSSEALYLGIAINMAQTLQINIPDLAEPILIQELKRRIWWSLFMSDYCSFSKGLPGASMYC
ncbi:hypothetical protein SBRCBS47491_006595 [Sporothrix bragantina]|uniref:Xylanolytic transcriptional activator regulatory domain-containing protein n=1 Tax=Sporothrix bragantina TaxID=671064 RepID=A0ABP0C6J2_9PEZI